MDNPVKLNSILTDEFLANLAVKYSETAEDHTGDYKAVKVIAELVAVMTANALGVVLQIEED
jgi:hypothetical protein